MKTMSAQLSLFNPERLSRLSNATPPTVRSFFTSDYDVAKLATAKPKSRVKYTETLGHWHAATAAADGAAELPLAAIGDAEILSFYRHLLETPGRYGRDRLADASIRRHLGRLRSILRLARKRGHIPRVPHFPHHAEDKTQRIERYWITDEEMERLIAEPGPCDKKRRLKSRGGGKLPGGDWWRALLYVTWWTAARISQVLALEWRDLSDEDVLEIRPLVKRATESRYVVLDAKCLALLAKLRPADSPPGVMPAYYQQKIFAGLGPHANLARHFKRLCKWAGIELPPGSAWHSLRRGKCAQQFRQLGLAFAQEALGHVDLATTEESYLNEQIRRAESIDRQRRLLEQQQLGRETHGRADADSLDGPHL